MKEGEGVGWIGPKFWPWLGIKRRFVVEDHGDVVGCSRQRELNITRRWCSIRFDMDILPGSVILGKVSKLTRWERCRTSISNRRTLGGPQSSGRIPSFDTAVCQSMLSCTVVHDKIFWDVAVADQGSRHASAACSSHGNFVQIVLTLLCSPAHMASCKAGPLSGEEVFQTRAVMHQITASCTTVHGSAIFRKTASGKDILTPPFGRAKYPSYHIDHHANKTPLQHKTVNFYSYR